MRRKKECIINMKQGELFQKLRKERRISQETLVQGLSSRSTLSSFENRNTQLSSEILFAYLDRLNITPNEFQFLLNSCTPTKKQKYSKLYHERHYERTLTTDFLESLLIEYHQSKDVFYLLLYLQGSLENARQEADFHSILFKEQAQTVQEYLFRIETWGKFEFTFFINLLFIFDEELLQRQMPQILDKIMTQAEDYLYSNMISVAILNGCHYATLKKNPSLLQPFLQTIDSLPNTPHYFYLKSHRPFYEQIHHYLRTKQIDLEQVNQALACFKQMGYDTHEERLRVLINDFML